MGGTDKKYIKCQKVQTSTCRINMHQGCDIQHEKYTEHVVLFMKVVERIYPNSSCCREKSILFCLILYLYEMRVFTKLTVIIIS